jgi:Flp pilus assembly protein TadG
MPHATRESTNRELFRLLVHQQVGAGLVEYAIVFILFVAMLLGIADFGRALYAYHFVSNAAREATRWAAVNGSTCSDDSSCPFANGAQASDVENFVTQHVPLGINPSSSVLTITPTWPSSSGVCATTPNAPGCMVDVKVQYSFTFVFQSFSATQHPLTLTSESQTVILH